MSIYRDNGGKLAVGFVTTMNNTGRPEYLYPVKAGVWRCPECGTGFYGDPPQLTHMFSQHYCEPKEGQ